MEKIKELLKKYKDIILYVIFGGLTTLVNMVVFWACDELLALDVLVSNVIAWFFAVLFAFLTNRVWVFNAKTKGVGQFLFQAVKFYAGRLATLGIEEILLLVFISWLALPTMPVKLAAQVIVIVLNYVISKLIIFKKK